MVARARAIPEEGHADTKCPGRTLSNCFCDGHYWFATMVDIPRKFTLEFEDVRVCMTDRTHGRSWQVSDPRLVYDVCTVSLK